MKWGDKIENGRIVSKEEVELSERETIAYQIIKENPGLTTAEIWDRMLGYTLSQVSATVNTALYRTKALVYPETKQGHYRWYVKEIN